MLTQGITSKMAGKLMLEINKFPVVHLGTTLAGVHKILSKVPSTFLTINYIYVVNEQNVLVGVLSIKDFFLNEKNTVVDAIMKKNIVTCRLHSEKNHIALLAIRHSLKSIPVIHKDGSLQGIIPHNVLLKIIDQEAVEDLFRFGGVYHPEGKYDNLMKIGIWQSIIHRLPWLLLGLAGGLLAAGVVHGFEETLSNNLVLAAFIPLIVYMADAVGTQIEAFIIRDLAMNPQLNFLEYFVKQFVIVFSIGALTSFLLFIVSLFLYENQNMSMVLSIALFFAILSSVVTGLIIPYIFGKFKLDPANASGPVATILQDIMSMFLYFTVANIFL